ncbi:MAG: Co2+/Mg2+ efflux protein ApaG [Bdellovibrionales bacterium]|nr:Co2+/Mg2+ efflux protein ApaG [Bdellovibrionales bacterium]
MYAEETQGVLIIAEPKFLEQESRPEESLYVFAYTITISNRSSETVQLVSRHWLITDGLGSTREVRGEGVIGQQPVIPPGEAFEYSSFSPIATPTGNMRGSYTMKLVSSGQTFNARIPLFFLRQLTETVH